MDPRQHWFSWLPPIWPFQMNALPIVGNRKQHLFRGPLTFVSQCLYQISWWLRWLQGADARPVWSSYFLPVYAHIYTQSYFKYISAESPFSSIIGRFPATKIQLLEPGTLWGHVRDCKVDAHSCCELYICLAQLWMAKFSAGWQRTESLGVYSLWMQIFYPLRAQFKQGISNRQSKHALNPVKHWGEKHSLWQENWWLIDSRSDKIIRKSWDK